MSNRLAFIAFVSLHIGVIVGAAFRMFMGV